MEAVLLKSNNPERQGDLVVFDEVIEGKVSNELFVPVFTGAHGGLHIYPMAFLVENYLFPTKLGVSVTLFISYLQGYNPELFRKVEYYEDDSIDVELM